jgi:hypothetical protein
MIMIHPQHGEFHLLTTSKVVEHAFCTATGGITGSDHLQTRRSSATAFEIGGGGWTAKPQRRALRVPSDIPRHDEPGALGRVRTY